jgi:nitrite reductase/ring-hydroxylating ferredoxin subunit
MKSELCKLADVPEQGAKAVDFFGRTALVYRHQGEPIATVAICAHLGGPLEWRDGALVCPWHGAEFDGASGRCTKWPQPGSAANHAMRLPTRVEGDGLFYVWGE